MSNLDQQELKFSSVEPDDLATYRRVSRHAIGALVFGLLALFVLMTPLMVWTSFMGATLAASAFRSLRKNPGEMIGRKAAILGLLLSLLFGVWGISRYVVRQQLIYRQAVEHTREWLDLVRTGDLHAAHQLLQAQSARQLPSKNLADYYRENEEARDNLEDRFEESPLNEIVDIGIDGPLRFVGEIGIRPKVRSTGTTEVVLQSYAIDYFVEGKARLLEFVIEIERHHIAKTGETRWHVVGVKKPDDVSL